MQTDQTPVGQIGVTGFTALLGQIATLGRTAQAIAGELARLSEENIDVSAKAVEKLRGARSMQDVASIQTDLVRESIEKSQSRFKKIAEIAAAAPGHTVENYRAFVASFTEAGRETARQMGDTARRGAEQVADAAHQATQQAGDAARRGFEQAADATQQAGDAAVWNTESFADAARKSANG
jgi:hypothetical protein